MKTKLTVDQAMRIATGKWPSAWECDPTDAASVLAEEIFRLREQIALLCEESAGDDEALNNARRLLRLFSPEVVFFHFGHEALEAYNTLGGILFKQWPAAMRKQHTGSLKANEGSIPSGSAENQGD